MSTNADDILQLIHKAAENDIRLNHLSAELHGKQFQRAFSGIQALLTVSELNRLERLVENPTSAPL
jgi:DNA-binding response OmpR family regulator